MDDGLATVAVELTGPDRCNKIDLCVYLHLLYSAEGRAVCVCVCSCGCWCGREHESENLEIIE